MSGTQPGRLQKQVVKGMDERNGFSPHYTRGSGRRPQCAVWSQSARNQGKPQARSRWALAVRRRASKARRYNRRGAAPGWPENAVRRCHPERGARAFSPLSAGLRPVPPRASQRRGEPQQAIRPTGLRCPSTDCVVGGLPRAPIRKERATWPSRTTRNQSL
jgi:hypothetical protein